MSADEYVPSEDEMREAYVWLSAGDNEGAREQATEDFNRGLARVRRDAARGAIDGLIADKAHMAVLLHAENGGNVEDVLTHYRDTHYPEETP